MTLEATTAALLNEFKAREFRLLQARQFYQ